MTMLVDPPTLAFRPVQARTIGRLKWRLWRNGFKRGGAQVIGTVISVLFSVALGLGGLVGGIAARAANRVDHVLAITVLAGVAWVASLFGPLLAGGIDETLPVSLLQPYPIARSVLVRGLVLSAIISPVAVGVALATAGTVIGATHSILGGGLAVACGLVLYVLLIVSGRLLPTVFARAMNSRRGKDAAIALVGLASLSGLLFQFLSRYLVTVKRARFETVERIMRWTPSGALGRGLVLGGRGEVRPAIVGLLLGLVGLAVVVTVWMWSLARLGEETTASEGPKRVRVAGAPLFNPRLGWLPRSAVGAVAARQVRYTMRDPRRRVGILLALVMGVVVPLINNAGKGANSAVLFGAGSSWLLVLSGMNQLGMDGRALWFDLMSGASPATLLRGRSLGLLVAAVPIVTLSCVTLAAITHGWAYLPAALLVGGAAALGGLGAASVLSVIAPMRVPEGTNPFAMNNSGQGCVAPLLGMVGLVVMVVLLLPMVVALILLKDRPLACALVGMVALPYGGLLWWLSLKLAARRLVQREPELIELVDPRK